jgi:hypothetical protein
LKLAAVRLQRLIARISMKFTFTWGGEDKKKVQSTFFPPNGL